LRLVSILDFKPLLFVKLFTLKKAADGKILSMSRQKRGKPDLRGKDLLTTPDEILPKK